LTSTALRERSLQIFDRAFAITYALEAIAVIIGLTGVSFAASSTASPARRVRMLRHVGMLRRQIVGMLASEGILTSAFGVAYGLALGTGLSLVLVYVIDRQSFNWSIDLASRPGNSQSQCHADRRSRRHRRVERTRRDDSGCRAGRARGLVRA